MWTYPPAIREAATGISVGSLAVPSGEVAVVPRGVNLVGLSDRKS
jgi:hypothetical protein